MNPNNLNTVSSPARSRIWLESSPRDKKICGEHEVILPLNFNEPIPWYPNLALLSFSLLKKIYLYPMSSCREIDNQVEIEWSRF